MFTTVIFSLSYFMLWKNHRAHKKCSLPFVELMKIFFCSLILASAVIQQSLLRQRRAVSIVWGWWLYRWDVMAIPSWIPICWELSCPQKASKMYHQRWWASFSHLYFITHRTHTCMHTHTHRTYIFSSPFYYHRFRASQKHYLLHLAAISPRTRPSFTYCQWPAPYKILAKHARSPLRYWESPCSHNPSWFVGTASYLACIT